MLTDDALQARLQSRFALVVHFSTVMGREQAFPDDLLAVIKGGWREWPLSCCVVWPDHPMRLPGHVGVVLSPRVQNVLSAYGDDAGSFVTPAGDNEALGSGGLSEAALEATFAPKGEYNEWRVRGAPVVAIYVDNPKRIVARRWVTLPDGEQTLVERPHTLAEVLAATCEPVVTYADGALLYLRR